MDDSRSCTTISHKKYHGQCVFQVTENSSNMRWVMVYTLLTLPFLLLALKQTCLLKTSSEPFRSQNKYLRIHLLANPKQASGLRLCLKMWRFGRSYGQEISTRFQILWYKTCPENERLIRSGLWHKIIQLYLEDSSRRLVRNRTQPYG